MQEQNNAIHAGYFFTFINLTNRLKVFRNLVLQQGNAQILNELDKLIDFTENESKPPHEQKNLSWPETFIACIVMFGFLLTPWVFGIYHLIKWMFNQ